MTILGQSIFLILTYFIAAIPFGLLVAKIYGNVDIRQVGSKNIGATNVTRILGKKLGFVTLILDGFKGAAMVIIARFTFGEISNLHQFLALVAGVAVVGHIYPIYLNFKGGKGVATAIATLFALDFGTGFLVGSFWLMAFCLFRISSVASILGIISSIIISNYFDAPPAQTFLCIFLAVLITYKHKENIVRLLTGEEKSFSAKSKDSKNV